MESDNTLTRRRFLRRTGALTGAAYLRVTATAIAAIAEAACTSRDDSAPFRVLGKREAEDFAAIAARIIPTTDTPGATEAGVIWFFDSAFAVEMSDQLEAAREGLAEFNEVLRSAYPDASKFPDLSERQQDAFLASREATGFFNQMWFMTILGFFSMEKYGGNRDNIGWDLIGFEGDHGAWQYPFGHYDAEVHEGEDS